MNETLTNTETGVKKLNLFQLILPVIAFLLNMYVIPIIFVLLGVMGSPLLYIKSAFDILIIIGTVWYFNKNGIKLFQNVKFKWWYLLLPIVVMVINIGKLPLMNLIMGEQPVANAEALTSLMGFDMVYTFIAASFIAPILEEIIFRGVIMGTIFKDKFWIGYLVSSVLFGLIHNITNLYSFVNYFSIGLLFGLVYKITNKSLAWSIAIHLINNLVFMLISMLTMSMM